MVVEIVLRVGCQATRSDGSGGRMSCGGREAVVGVGVRLAVLEFHFLRNTRTRRVNT